MIIFFALSVLLPLGLAMLIAFRYWRNGWVLLSLIAFTLFGMVYAGFNAPWFLYSYWLLLGLSVVVVASVLAGLQKLRRVYWYWPSIPVLGFTVLLIVGSVYFAVSGVLAIGATRAPDQVVELEFPLRNGVFAIVQGGSGPPLQGGHAGTPSQTYAIDAVRLNSFGTTSSKYLSPDRSADLTLGEPVYSPCDGEVVWARDGIPDVPDFEGDTPAGNAVAIACHGIVIGFGHFQNGSVTVAIGDQVDTNTRLGVVGLSGNTGGPHLHFHAERGEWQGDVSDNPGVAMTFDGRFLWSPQIVDLRQ